MWSEKEMKEVVLAFQKADEEKQRKQDLAFLKKLQIGLKEAKNNYNMMLQWAMFKTVGIVAFDVLIWLSFKEIIAAVIIFSYTSIFVMSQTDIKKQLDIGKSAYKNLQTLYMTKKIEYIEKYQNTKEKKIEDRHVLDKYILDTESLVRDAREKKIEELHQLKESLQSCYVESASKKVL